jgi:hypothetical protein
MPFAFIHTCTYNRFLFFTSILIQSLLIEIYNIDIPSYVPTKSVFLNCTVSWFRHIFKKPDMFIKSMIKIFFLNTTINDVWTRNYIKFGDKTVYFQCNPIDDFNFTVKVIPYTFRNVMIVVTFGSVPMHEELVFSAEWNRMSGSSAVLQHPRVAFPLFFVQLFLLGGVGPINCKKCISEFH